MGNMSVGQIALNETMRTKRGPPLSLRSPLYPTAYYTMQPLRHVFVTSRSRPSEVIVGFRYAFFIPVPPLG